jgi:hypothetical protein
MGLQQVKNIEDPIRAYAARELEDDSSTDATKTASHECRPPPELLHACLLFVALASIAAPLAVPP